MTDTPTSTAEMVGGILGTVASFTASAFIPVGTLQDIVKLAATYGPEAVTGIIALFKSPNVTVAEVEAAFANLKPLEAYGLPVTVPTIQQP